MTFIEKIIARLQGKDDAQVNAEKITKKIVAFNTQQKAAKEIKKMEVEQKIEDLKEELELLKYPIEVPSDVNTFYNAIKNKHNEIIDAEEELEGIVNAIAFIDAYSAEIQG